MRQRVASPGRLTILLQLGGLSPALGPSSQSRWQREQASHQALPWGLRDSSTLISSPSPPSQGCSPGVHPLGPSGGELAWLPPAGLGPPLRTVLGEGEAASLRIHRFRCSGLSVFACGEEAKTTFSCIKNV